VCVCVFVRACVRVCVCACAHALFNEKIINRALFPLCSLYLNISSGNFKD